MSAKEGAIAATLQRMVLDSRYPQLLSHRGHVLQVVAGHVDLFAVSIAGAEEVGSRQHLFRVENGQIILDLPEVGSDPGERMRVIAVGAPLIKAGTV